MLKINVLLDVELGLVCDDRVLNTSLHNYQIFVSLDIAEILERLEIHILIYKMLVTLTYKVARSHYI